MQIPIQNIYYLLCYAWNKLDESEVIQVNAEDFETLLDLFAKILHEGTLHILKAGVDRSYISEINTIPGIRGKLLFNDSIKENSFIYGKAVCEYDELSPNILHNQILKTTIGQLLKVNSLNDEIKDELFSVYNKLQNIDEIKITNRDFSSIRLHRNNMYYSFVMNVCKLIFESISLNEQNGEYEFIDFYRDEKKMAALFEAFVLNFYKRELREYHVHAPFIQWNAEPLDDSSLEYLPRMETDIVLESSQRTLIIDTKYYKETMKEGQYGKEKINRDNLFQIFSYVQNYDKTVDSLEGMLLYPTVKDEVSQSYLIHDKKISVKTINLNKEWQDIASDLKMIIE